MELGIEIEQPAVVKSLLSKMDASPGFAGMGEAVQAVCRLVEDDGSNSQIVAAALRDPALAAKLLSVANSSRYPRGAGNVSTIDQVLALLGMGTVMSVAVSLDLLTSISNKSQSNHLHAEIVAASFAGNLATEITRRFGSSFSVQEAKICGQMQNLGRMNALFYLYEDIERSRKLQIEKNLAENEAVKQTLGVSFEDIGVAIAHHWVLPEVIQKSLLPDIVELPPQEPAANAMAWQQLCSLFCRRITALLFRLPENREKIEVSKCIDFFQKALRLNGKEVLELIEKCLPDTEATLSEMNFPCNLEDARNLLRKASERSTDMLAASDSLVQKGEGQTPIDKVKHIMRLVHDHCSFDCTLICLPSGVSGLVAIAGVGRNAGLLTTKFRSSGIQKDIFQTVVVSKKNTFIADINSPEYFPLIPKWYHEFVKARSCVMMPLVSDGKLFGLIYGDYSKPQASMPTELKDAILQEWRIKLTQILIAGPKSKA